MKTRWPISLCAVLTILTLLAACHKNDGPLHMVLTVSPDHPRMTRPITFTVHVTENGQPVTNAEVVGTITMKSMDMGKTELKFTAKGNGDYEASLKGMDMSGEWNLAVDATQGGVHTKKNFDFTVGD